MKKLFFLIFPLFLFAKDIYFEGGKMSLQDLTNTVSIETGASIILYQSLKDKIVYLRVSKIVKSDKLLEYYRYLLDANGLAFNQKNDFYVVTPVTDLKYFEYKFKYKKSDDFKIHIESFKDTCTLSTELLFCYALPKDIDRLQKMVKAFDVAEVKDPNLYKNVKVDLSIVETNYDDLLNLKSSLVLNSTSKNVNSTFTSDNALNFALSLFTSGTSIIDTHSLNYIFDFLEKKGISTFHNKPNLMITNGYQSSIVTGGTQRVIATETKTEDLSATTKTYQEFTSGLQLTVKVNIIDNDNVMLTLTFSNDDVVGGTNELPVTSKQSYITTMVVKKSQSLILGGVIYDKKTTTNYKVPFLGDIPLIGLPFNGKTENKSRKILSIVLHVKDLI